MQKAGECLYGSKCENEESFFVVVLMKMEMRG
jgi:hypothetical protein